MDSTPRGVFAAETKVPSRETYEAEEAFARLGIGPTLGWRLIRANEIPHLRLGRRVVVPKASLDRMLGHAND
jgi:excisionase family DNA binding protein